MRHSSRLATTTTERFRRPRFLLPSKEEEERLRRQEHPHPPRRLLCLLVTPPAVTPPPPPPELLLLRHRRLDDDDDDDKNVGFFFGSSENPPRVEAVVVAASRLGRRRIGRLRRRRRPIDPPTARREAAMPMSMPRRRPRPQHTMPMQMVRLILVIMMTTTTTTILGLWVVLAPAAAAAASSSFSSSSSMTTTTTGTTAGPSRLLLQEPSSSTTMPENDSYNDDNGYDNDDDHNHHRTISLHQPLSRHRMRSLLVRAVDCGGGGGAGTTRGIAPTPSTSWSGEEHGNDNGNDNDNVEFVLDKAMQGSVSTMSDAEICTLLSETCASLATHHPTFEAWASRIVLFHLRRVTPPSFHEAMELLEETLHPALLAFIRRHADTLNEWTTTTTTTTTTTADDGDVGAAGAAASPDLTYLGLSTLQRSYLLRNPKTAQIAERPEYMYLRVALGIHCPLGAKGDKGRADAPANHDDIDDETHILQDAHETYRMLLNGTMTHASPTLFHAGTRHAQLSSCFLLQMTDDSIRGIYETLARCAVVSKGAGGIGLAVSKIRARGTRIAGTGGTSNGLVPMLRVYDATCRYVDQGGGKRPGAFAIYLEPWHADVYELLNLKKNHGKEEQRARDLFYGLWIPDLFMERVYHDQTWSLFCPHQCPGLHERHGQDFVDLYLQYEAEGKFVRQVKARDLWTAILDSQIETGTPYMCYKDACNAKSNHKHLGTISSSNLCTEIIQYTSPDEVAVCNLASLCLPRFVRVIPTSDTRSDDQEPKDAPESAKSLEFGSPPANLDGEGCEQRWFDHAALHRAVKVVTRNLNKIIDINQYPVPEAEVSNRLHRPIGIGVSGLADTFVRLGYPFGSEAAKQLNRAIFETMYHAALEASAELAERDGCYSSFQGSPASHGQLQYHLWDMSDDETPSRRQFGGFGAMFAGRRHGYTDDVAAQGGYDWAGMRKRIMQTGLRNSLLLAPMPTASTSQILGVNECFEPFSSNLYIKRVKAGEFVYANPHLLHDLSQLGLWTPSVRNQLMRDGGSVQGIADIPQRIKDLYKTVWEISMKDVIDMAADRGRFVDQSQSLNLFVANPTFDKLTAMHFHAWRQGLKTGMYYLRTKPAVNAIQYTVDKDDQADVTTSVPVIDEEACTSCSA